ncbi:ParA family protein [Sphingobium sp. TCM1]|uniref:ParA family protein n=1 Tax=Sphingobium sp. TCM1 TaxID=453246 RepID=UPI0007F3ACDC|nr:ParA family protein [Sphingobium sp. TCM1]OAN54307.1 chromosome partitioning protein ParA [Sphingobium sp. TCM1]
MPTIAFISPKGGVGKTTAALLLASQLARGAQVCVIDADPNRPIANWAKDAALPETLSIMADVDEDTILDRIEDAAASAPFVIVDLEGTAAKIVLLAVSQADLVIIPMQGSQLDAEQASRAIRVLKQHERMTGRAVPYGVLLSRTSPIIRTRTMGHIQDGLTEASVPLFDTQLNEREAFRAIFSFRQTLDALDPGDVPNLDKAIANAEQFAVEVIERLRGARTVAAGRDYTAPAREGRTA